MDMQADRSIHWSDKSLWVLSCPGSNKNLDHHLLQLCIGLRVKKSAYLELGILMGFDPALDTMSMGKFHRSS